MIVQECAQGVRTLKKFGYSRAERVEYVVFFFWHRFKRLFRPIKTEVE
jgi:hypothetical protein